MWRNLNFIQRKPTNRTNGFLHPFLRDKIQVVESKFAPHFTRVACVSCLQHLGLSLHLAAREGATGQWCGLGIKQADLGITFQHKLTKYESFIRGKVI